MTSCISNINSKKYPCVLLPKKITDAFSLDEIEVGNMPIEPNKPIKKASTTFQVLYMLSPIYLPVVGFYAITTGLLWLYVPLSVVMVLFLGYQKDTLHYDEDELAMYNRNLSKFSKDLDSYNNAMKVEREKRLSNQYRKRILDEVLSSAIMPNEYIPSKKGVSEGWFENYLNKWFPEKIFKNWSIKLSIEYNPYQADFIYQDEKCHIDIEIDEPYSLQDNMPIHYTIGERITIDWRRDDFFTDYASWVVIRFAEEQVVNFPNECCKVIAQAVSELTGNHKYLDLMREVKTLKSVARWSESDCHDMIAADYRKTYLVNCAPSDKYVNYWNEKIQRGYKPDFNKMIEEKRKADSIDDLPF